MKGVMIKFNLTSFLELKLLMKGLNSLFQMSRAADLVIYIIKLNGVLLVKTLFLL